MFVLNGHRSANRPRPRNIASEPDEIRMRNNSIVDVDGEIVGRIASASLCHKDKVPGPIVRGSSDGSVDIASVIDLEASLSKLSGARHQADY